MMRNDVLPSTTVKQLGVVAEDRVGEVLRTDLLCAVDAVHRDALADQVPLQEVLQTKENHIGVVTSAGLEIGVDRLGVGRILQVVCDLVRVRTEQDVVPQIHIHRRFQQRVDLRSWSGLPLSSSPDRLEVVINKQLSIAKDFDQTVLRGVPFPLGNCAPLFVLVLQGQLSGLRFLAGVRNGIFQHVDWCSRDHSVGAFEGTLEAVSMHFLKQRAARTEGNVVGSPAFFLHGLQDPLQSVDVDAIPLDDADAGRE
mmetsp:Transcript_41614/g.89923  ORF Transcript_41614/g.89923 Transcript_41614/m.89923 type:complete len:254 (-) Transcript_41614:236-997(-)